MVDGQTGTLLASVQFNPHTFLIPSPRIGYSSHWEAGRAVRSFSCVMPAVARDKLLDDLRRSGLLDDQRLDRFLDDQDADADGEVLLQKLVDANLLTPWQAEGLQ